MTKSSSKKRKRERERAAEEEAKRALETDASAASPAPSADAAAAASTTTTTAATPPSTPTTLSSNNPVAILNALVRTCRRNPSFDKHYRQHQNWPRTAEGDFGAAPRVFGLDCEMVSAERTDPAATPGTAVSLLARMSLVQVPLAELFDPAVAEPKYTVVFDHFVQTPEQYSVVDHLTHITGIQAEHLGSAMLDAETAQKLILDHVRAGDYLVGHSLWADFAAVKVWHEQFIDTSLLVGVSEVPNMTLGLKDVAEEFLGESDTASFQAPGEAHDPRHDAEYALRVLPHIARALSAPSESSADGTYLVSRPPSRFRERLTVQNLPVSCTPEHVLGMIARDENDAAARFGLKLPLRAMKTSTRGKDLMAVKSLVLEFDSEAHTREAFKAFQAALRGCGGYPSSGPSHPDGWMSSNGFYRKLVICTSCANAASSNKLPATSEVTTYLAPESEVSEEMPIKQTGVGRIMGPKGARIVAIQQQSGARATLRHRGQPRPDGTNAFELSADSKAKLDKAKELITRAASGDTLGIP